MRRLISLMLVLLVIGVSVLSSTPAQAQAAWAPNTAYSIGTLVTYQDATHPNHIYKCIQAHTSLVGWEPPNVPALWQDMGPAGTTSTNTPVPPTKTNTPSAPTATKTNTPLGPTATKPPATNTPVPPTKTNTPVAGNDGSPYGGTAAAIPGTVQAENFNTGGQGVAYNDAEATNQGGQYRTAEGVDIEATTDTGAGYNVGWTANGEWMKYTVNVTTGGAYTIDFRVASAQAGGSIHLEVDGVNVTGALTVPNTGGWQTWTTVTKTGVNLTTGSHVLRLVTDATGGNYNWIKFTSGTVVPTNTPVSTIAPTKTNTPVTPPSATPTSGGTTTCAVQSPPTGKVLMGYWESWDGAANGVHPGMGWIPLSQVHSRYNVITLAFPVILSDGTAKWETGMDTGVKVPTPAEMCAAKANGRYLLLSIGGAAAGIDLSSTTVADRFISTIVPILKANNFDGIDFDIESGLTAGASMSSLSTAQSNLIRIIDGVLAQMPSNFGLTMAPETAYVTGGQIAYGGPWGAYLPIIKRYLDNGRLSWLNMQYYNGSMYGCPATSFSAGTVQGFVEQTKCLNAGFTAGGGTFQIPYSKQVPGLPAQPGAGGGYMDPSLVSQAYSQVSGIKGLMTWSINWDGSKGWTFANNRPW